MNLVRYIAGLLLASFGALMTLGSLAGILEPESADTLSPWAWVIVFASLGILPLGGATLLLKKHVAEIPVRACPKCGSERRAKAFTLSNARNVWVFHLGGWFLSALWAGSRGRPVRCLDCDAGYSTETRGARIAGIILWVLIILIGFGIVMEQLRKAS